MYVCICTLYLYFLFQRFLLKLKEEGRGEELLKAPEGAIFANSIAEMCKYSCLMCKVRIRNLFLSIGLNTMRKSSTSLTFTNSLVPTSDVLCYLLLCPGRVDPVGDKETFT